MSERRNNLRQRSFLRGRVFFDHNRSAADCLIRDVSDTGARLAFSSMVPLPDAFDLYIPQKEVTLQARVQWRRGDEIGVVFPQAAHVPEQVAAESSDLASRVHKLESEITAIKRVLKRLQAVVPAADPDAA